jgi:hypothetical protein
MQHKLFFDRLAEYDAGLPGITIPVTLELIDQTVELEAKLSSSKFVLYLRPSCSNRYVIDAESLFCKMC